MTKSNNTKGTVLVALAAVSWGIFPIFNRTLSKCGIDTLTSTCVRAVIGATAYIVWGISKGTFKNFNPKCLIFYLFYGLISVVGTTYLYAEAQILLSSSAMAAVLLYTAPAFVIIFNRILYKEPITKVKLFTLILTFSGCFLVSGGYNISNLKINSIGLIVGLLSGFCYSTLTIIGKSAVKKYPSDLNSFMPTIMASIIFLFMVPPWTISIPNTFVLVNYLLLGITGTVIPYTLYMKGLSTGIDGGRAILIANIEPIVAAILGVIVFGDTLSPLQITGVVITLTGAGISSLSKQ